MAGRDEYFAIYFAPWFARVSARVARLAIVGTCTAVHVLQGKNTNCPVSILLYFCKIVVQMSLFVYVKYYV